MEEPSQGSDMTQCTCPEGHSGSNVVSANSWAEKEELRRGDQREGCVVVMATGEEGGIQEVEEGMLPGNVEK